MIAKALSLCALLALQPNFSNTEKNVVRQEAESHKKFNSMYGDYSLGVHPNSYGWTWAVDYGFSPGEEPSVQGKDWFFKGNEQTYVGTFIIFWMPKVGSLEEIFDSVKVEYELGQQLRATNNNMLYHKSDESSTKKMKIDGVPGLFKEFEFNLKKDNLTTVTQDYLLVFQERYRTYFLAMTLLKEPLQKGFEKEHKKFIEDSEKLWEDTIANFRCLNTPLDSVEKIWK